MTCPDFILERANDSSNRAAKDSDMFTLSVG